MKIEDIFENMRPVATVWKKRGDRIERGRISKFVPNLQALKKIEIEHGSQEGEKSARRDGDAESDLSGKA